ncbi:hypothetical protein ACKC6H_002746 [Acinetobacter baumannii]
MRTFGFFTAGVFVLAWLFFPNLFQWWAIHVWSIPVNQLDEMGKLGPLGDIYGSLNTLFTSVTLIIVVYSAYLQRQANKDAREAMEKQLQQAKEATTLQLNEARRALELQLKQTRQAASDQIAHATMLHELQLAQAQQASAEQLEVTKASFKGQIEESRYAIFSNMFYSLLNYKHNLLTSIEMNEIIGLGTINQKREKRSAIQIIRKISHHFYHNIAKEQPVEYANFNIDELRSNFYEFSENTFEGSINTLLSYFLIYISILNLIKKSKVSEDDKNFFKSILRNSMYQDEQFILFWIAPMFNQMKIQLEFSEIFTQFEYEEVLKEYALKHYNETFFASKNWKQIFQVENPT